MEIECTKFVDEIDCCQLSGSIAELGENAGRITWNGCMELATEFHPITADEASFVRDYFREYGAWEDEDIDAWTLQELNALIIQEIAANVRDLERFESYGEYLKAAEDGRVQGMLFKGYGDKYYCGFYR